MNRTFDNRNNNNLVSNNNRGGMSQPGPVPNRMMNSTPKDTGRELNVAIEMNSPTVTPQVDQPPSYLESASSRRSPSIDSNQGDGGPLNATNRLILRKKASAESGKSGNLKSPSVEDGSPVLGRAKSGSVDKNYYYYSEGAPHSPVGAAAKVSAQEFGLQNRNAKPAFAPNGGIPLIGLREMPSSRDLKSSGAFTPSGAFVSGDLMERRIWFTYFMTVANVAVFIVEMYLAKWQFAPVAVNPTFGPDSAVLFSMGAKSTARIRNAGEWWRLFSATVLHSGLVHLGMNMLMFLRLGSDLERAFGWFKVMIIYVLSGVSGNILSCLFNENVLGVGASGCIYGLIGALFGDFLQNHKLMEKKWCYLLSITVNTAIGIGLGLLPIIDNFAHLGGFICGIMCGCIFFVLPGRDARGNIVSPKYSKALSLVSILLLVLWFIGGLLLLFSIRMDFTKLCPYCHYLDCVESPWWSCQE